MRQTIPYCIIISFLIILHLGCAKEYSYEGGPPPPIVDTGNNTDTTPPVEPPPQPISNYLIRPCSTCVAGVTDTGFNWMFTVDSVSVCGPVTKALISPNRDGFTFFGPWSCSRDSGLIITAFLENITLDHDLQDIVPRRSVIQYYNNITFVNVFDSGQNPFFSLTIEKYDHSTSIAIGRFSGASLTPDGKVVNVSDGRFRIHLTQ